MSVTPAANEVWRNALARQWSAMCHLANRPAPYADDGKEGGLTIPFDVSRGARMTLALALLTADVDGVVSMADLTRAAGLTVVKVRRHVAELVEANLVKRIVGKAMVRIAYSRLWRLGWQTCQHCPRPVVYGAQKARYCATCMATLVRHDRQWRAHAFEVWASAPKGDSEAKVVYRVHMQTSQPLFTRRGSEADETKEGIVNWMVHTGLLLEKQWPERMKAHAAGEDGE